MYSNTRVYVDVNFKTSCSEWELPMKYKSHMLTNLSREWFDLKSQSYSFTFHPTRA